MDEKTGNLSTGQTDQHAMPVDFINNSNQYIDNPNDVSPEPFGNEEGDDQDELDRNLSRVMSRPDNLQRLESLTRVLSSRRLSAVSSVAGTLNFDPEDFDLNILLKTIRRRFDEQGMAGKYSGVAFKNLTVNGVDSSTSCGPSVTQVLIDLFTFPSVIKNMLKPSIRSIIRNSHGIVRNGEMVLVLGRPGSGCTTLLKTLSGEISQFTSVDGDISYDGATLHDMLAHFKSEVIYNPERKYFFFIRLLFGKISMLLTKVLF